MKPSFYENKFYSTNPTRIRRLIKYYESIIAIEMEDYLDYYDTLFGLDFIEPKQVDRKRTNKSLANFYWKVMSKDTNGLKDNYLKMKKTELEKYKKTKLEKREITIRWQPQQ